MNRITKIITKKYFRRGKNNNNDTYDHSGVMSVGNVHAFPFPLFQKNKDVLIGFYVQISADIQHQPAG